MDNSKPRVDIAREAFLKGDKKLARIVHRQEIIERSIKHGESHKTAFRLPEIILGGQDGLVNVLGLVLGVAAATSDGRVVIAAALAATFAESISMAGVAYTSKLAEADYYQSEYEREKWEVENFPEAEGAEVRAMYKRFGFTGKLLDDIVRQITSNKRNWVELMMAQELKLEPVDRKSALSNSLIVGFSTLVGSIIPLFPFFILHVSIALRISLILSSIILFMVGYYKAKVTLGRSLIRQGLEMMIIGIVSALVGYLIGSIFKI